MESIDHLIAYYEECVKHPGGHPLADTPERRTDTLVYLHAYRQARLALVTLAHRPEWRQSVEEI